MREPVESMAARLRAAYVNGPIAPLRDGLDGSDGERAYAVQAVNTRFWTDCGRKPVGHKIGLTAKSVQTQLGVSQPDFGVLFADMQIENGAVLAFEKCIAPRAEAEVALVLSHDVDDPHATAENIADAIDYAVAAIEIVDSRIADWTITFADTVADNGSSAFYVLGEERAKLSGLDLFTCGMALDVNGQIVSVGSGAACLDHPLNAAAWLARTLSGAGTLLKAGDLILTGALGPMVSLTSGDRVRARIGGLGECRFEVS